MQLTSPSLMFAPEPKGPECPRISDNVWKPGAYGGALFGRQIGFICVYPRFSVAMPRLTWFLLATPTPGVYDAANRPNQSAEEGG